MKLEEAASILGVSLEDITVDGLKQTYKKLALTWDAEKNSADQNSKTKYLQISEAYKKLASVMEGKDPYKVDDSHEIAAFMRMFMDMVGISENDSIPAAMTFGMMFGSNQNVVEEWSTDEDGDEDYDDDDDDDDCDDDDDEEYLPDEYFDEYAAVANGGPIPMSMPMPMHGNPYAQAMGAARAAAQAKSTGPAAEAWEPQVKQYSNMNLKDQLNMQRMQAQRGELADDDSEQEQEIGEAGEELNDAERERKLKLAKKRADKRKKQKEKDKKKSKEGNAAAGEATEKVGVAKDFANFADLAPEELTRLIRLHTDHIITELMHSVTNGQLGKVNQILSFDFAEEVPPAVAEEMVALLKQELPSTPVLHQCVTNLARMTTNAPANSANASADGANSAAFNTAMFTALAARRLEVARYLLNFSRPAFEIGTVNTAGLSVLHYAIVSGDLKIAQLIIRAITQVTEDRKVQLNINSRCHRQGWAPIHYAVEKLDLEAVKLLAQNGANVQVTMATDKRQTPMELAKQKLKTSNAAGKPAAQAVIDELQAAIDRTKVQKEAESKSKKLEAAGSAPEAAAKTTVPSVAPANKDNKKVVAEPVVPEVVESAKADKKKKKKDKDGKEKPAVNATAPAAPVPAPKVEAPAPVIPPVPAAVAQAPIAAAGKSVAAPAAAVAPSTPAPAPTKNKKGKGAKNAAAPPPVPEPTINAMAEMSVSSRDELVDRLLAMGFREADCLQAISLYGTDTDQAISWLCERPVVAAPPPPPATSKPEASKSKDAAAPMSLGASMAASSPRTAPLPAPATPVAAGSNGGTAANAPSSAQKLQKEKEELRRINRAWNLKAEDEKRKAEAQRKQAEIEKQLADLQAKQQAELLRQQQAQQEFAYQQHLQQQQQYMALQQQQMQTYYAAQQAAMFGVGASGGVGDGAAAAQYAALNNAGNSNFSMGSLQHMTNMLGASGAAHGSSSSASGSSFGAHPSIGAVSGSSGHSSGGPALQTLSGAMAMAMGGDSHQSLYKPAHSAAPASGTPSLSDVMAMSYSAPHAAASNLQSSSGGLATGSASGLFGLGLSSAPAGVTSSSSLSSGQNSLGLFGHGQVAGDSLADFSFSGGLMNDGLFGQREGIVDGALELSAGAKPFVPRFGSTTSTASTASPASSTLSGAPSLGAFGLNSTLGSGLGGLGLGGAPGLGWDAKPSSGESKISNFLSNLLPSDLNLDEDSFGYGDDGAIIPGLESFLLNDN